MALKIFLAAASALVLMGAQSARADAIPYPNSGTYNDADYTFFAPSSGDVVGYFDGSSAGDTTVVGLDVNGVMTAEGYGLNNQSAVIGQSFDFGYASAGALLTFVFDNTDVGIAYSDPSLNTAFDAPGQTEHNHIYATSFTASDGIPSGTYIGFEDTPFPYADDDYNDESFVFTNASEGVPPVSSAPEPSAWMLMIAGMLGVGSTLRQFKGLRRVAD